MGWASWFMRFWANADGEVAQNIQKQHKANRIFTVIIGNRDIFMLRLKVA